MGLLVPLQKPASGAAQGIVAVKGTVVVEHIQGGEALLREEALHLGGGGPPVVVVALYQIFLTGELVQEAEVRLRLLQGDAPGGVSRQDQHVVCGQLAQGRADPGCVILPRRAEHLHGFVGGQGEVQVPDGVEGHTAPLLSFIGIQRRMRPPFSFCS